MKPSQRIAEILIEKYRATAPIALPNAIMDYLDEQAELLDTHTVKERSGFELDNGTTGVSASTHQLQEEPTTPEKKCCIPCKEMDIDGQRCECICHQEEPQYKIACNDCGSGKQLWYPVYSPIYGGSYKPYDVITKETRSHEKKCPSCGSINVEAKKI